MHNATGFDIAVEEMDRVHAETVQGEQSIAVQIDMKKWAKEKGLWPVEPYKNIIVLHAIDRGWLQEYNDGMEICG
jgi:hypothetical protein